MVFRLRPLLAGIAFAAAVAQPVARPVAVLGKKPLVVSAEKAPVVPDGTTAGAATDLVVTFEDPDPDVDGLRLKAGARLVIELDEAFTNHGAGTNSVVLLQGWPQSPPSPPPFPWTVEVDGNTVTVTLTEDYGPGPVGPGPKQAHLILFGFANPAAPGVYPFELTIHPKPHGKKMLRGSGTVRILPDARPSVDPISLFSGPPGPPPPFYNPLYQTLELGEPARQLGLYLWDADSIPFVGVDVTPTSNPTYYELTDFAGENVGDIWITPPADATDYSFASVPLPPGGPPSVEVAAFVTGVPVGLLGVQFTPDPWTSGDYEIAIAMKGGNEKTLFVTVRDGESDDDDDSDDDDSDD